MKFLLIPLLVCACAPAAYEVIRQPRPEAPTPKGKPPAEEPKPVQPAPEPEPPKPTPGSGEDVTPAEPEPDPLPEIEQSVQQEAPVCNAIALCSRRELPRCNKTTEGLIAHVVATDTLFACHAGRWRELDTDSAILPP